MNKLIFTFSMLGLRCTAPFDTMPEALAWIGRCFAKGYFLPVSLQGTIDGEPVFLYGEELIELTKGKHA